MLKWVRKAAIVTCWLAACGVGATAQAAAAPTPTTAPAALPEDTYEGYRPDYANDMPDPLKEGSVQAGFYNRAAVVTDQRSDALIAAGIKAEQSGDFAEATKHYQGVIDKYPESMIQLSQWGVYFPASRYAQLRILRFPPKALAYYRLEQEGRARETYEGARARNSVEGLHDVVNYYLATRYGALALRDIGNGALDRGEAEHAARCFEQIRRYYPAADFDGQEAAGRLALAYQRLGDAPKLSALNRELQERWHGAPLPTPAAAGPPPEFKPPEFTPQRRNPRYQSFSDYAWWPSPAKTLSGTERSWVVELPQAPLPTLEDRLSKGELLPFHLPWIVGNDLYYKHYNRIYCRSLVSGEPRWECDLGLLDRFVRRLIWFDIGTGNKRASTQTIAQADQDILVDDECVYANIRVYGQRESLLALDRVTGELRWSAGSFRPRTEADLTRRYDGTPALGRRVVYAPWSQDEGDAYTTVGLSAMDSATGRVLWERDLCRLTPTVTTQKKMGIRVFSSTPLVKEGIIYHATGAGVVAALDEVSGTVLWLMRYPHYWDAVGNGRVPYDAHDATAFGLPGTPWEGPQFRNHWPLVQGNRLYVAPFDSKRFLCLDKDTGKELWSINAPAGPFEGVAPGGELVFSVLMNRPPGYPPPTSRRGIGYQFYRMDSGEFAWEFFPAFRCSWHWRGDYPGEYLETYGVDRPVFTEDGHLLLSTVRSPALAFGLPKIFGYGEWCLSVPERKVLDYRGRYDDMFTSQVGNVVGGFLRNSKDAWRYQADRLPASMNCPADYDPVKRMPFRHHGVLFELVDSGDSMGMVYDASALRAAVGGEKTAREIYTEAELTLREGRDDAVIALLEKCRNVIKPEERNLDMEIRRMLFQLSRTKAWKALLAGDKQAVHHHLERMAAMASTLAEETQGVIAFAKSFASQGDLDRAAACWVNIIKHYPQVVCEEVSAAMDDPSASELLAQKLRDTEGWGPAGWKKEFTQVDRAALGSLPAQFSTLAPAEPDLLVGAEEYASGALRAILAQTPDFRPRFEEQAEAALRDAGADSEARLRAMTAYPGTKAALRVLAEAWDASSAVATTEKQTRRWLLQDLAMMQGSTPSPKAQDEARLLWKPPPPIPWGRAFTDAAQDFSDYGEHERLLLRRSDRGGEQAHLVFIGGRAKKRVDNKFSLECWDVRGWKKLWGGETNIRLKGKGDEPGFQEALLCGDTIIVHGKYDVLAWNTATGALRWRWEAPLDFDLRGVAGTGDMVVLAGARHTLGVHRLTGQVVWSEEERGELYCPPILRSDLLVTVRRDPCGVTFRRLQTGRLLRTIKIEELSDCVVHPVFAAEFTRGTIDFGLALDALPVADDGDLLMLSDRANYLAIDLAQGRVRWRRPIDNNDSPDSPLRFQISGSYVTVLKRDYTSPAFYMLDANTGAVKWVKKDQEALCSPLADPKTGELYGIAAPDLQKRGWVLKCVDAETGAEKRRLARMDWEAFPETQILETDGEGRLAVRLLHGKGKSGEMWLVDGKKMEVMRTLTIEGASAFGVAGGNSCISQDGYWVALWPGKMSACRRTEAAP